MALPTVSSVVSSGLAGYPTVFYNKVAEETLYSNLFMYSCTDPRTLPGNSGVAIQLYNHTKMASNTSAVTEGTPFSGQALTQNVATINLSNYADFITVSKKVELTAFPLALENGAKLLGYRGALSVENIIGTLVDVAANGDSTANIDVNLASYMTSAIARKVYWQLRSKDVQMREGGFYTGLIHSLSAYDLVSESAAGSNLDLQKYSEKLASNNQALVGIQGKRLGVVGGINWFESNALNTTSNWQSSASIAYSNYTFGLGAVFSSSLGKTALDQDNFSVSVKRYDEGNSIDPTGQIAGAAFYSFFFGAVKSLDSATVNHFRRVRIQSSIG